MPSKEKLFCFVLFYFIYYCCQSGFLWGKGALLALEVTLLALEEALLALEVTLFGKITL